MADETKPKKDKGAPAAEAKPKKEKAPKDAGAEAAPAAPKKEKPAEPPRPPADPRLKVMKKFRGRFLPKGPLRDRHKELIRRWQTGDDHGGVTVEELQALLNDWRKARETKGKATAGV